MSRTGRILPLIGFGVVLLVMAIGIWWNTHHNPEAVPSALIDEKAPDYKLPRLNQPETMVSRQDMLGQAYLLNVFGSWCFACREEHPVLMRRVRNMDIPLIGYDYRDKTEDARAWLKRRGNPYQFVIVDKDGRTAINFGVSGAPETFLIDAEGIIRYKHVGPLTPEVINNELKPELAALAGEADT